LAIRAWLETAIPPVFGKEMGNELHVANTSNMGIGLFISDFGVRISDLNPQFAIVN
jgi:hypothetical protein